VQQALDFILPFDDHSRRWSANYGGRRNAILFGIIFTETAVVIICTFLPGEFADVRRRHHLRAAPTAASPDAR